MKLTVILVYLFFSLYSYSQNRIPFCNVCNEYASYKKDSTYYLQLCKKAKLKSYNKNCFFDIDAFILCNRHQGLLVDMHKNDSSLYYRVFNPDKIDFKTQSKIDTLKYPSGEINIRYDETNYKKLAIKADTVVYSHYIYTDITDKEYYIHNIHDSNYVYKGYFLQVSSMKYTGNWRRKDYKTYIKFVGTAINVFKKHVDSLPTE
ncbi:MAG: hypothetical protein M0D57_13065 [Sphingobacteriales bacterium JAD_PAG50586_3]|nr:MAG: hypothetical protein M0D57_13065 [Sphingobacteriales bacterium JAD_PAG50586_3]